MSRDRYFSALELVDPDPSLLVNGWHPHVTMHYFGAIPVLTAVRIAEFLQPWSWLEYILIPDSIEKFGSGQAVSFRENDDLRNFKHLREQISRRAEFGIHIDQTFPHFVPHMSLPEGYNPPALPQTLRFRGPVLLATQSVTVRV